MATQSCLAANSCANLKLTSQQCVTSILKRPPPNLPLGERISPHIPQNVYSPTFIAPTRSLREDRDCDCAGRAPVPTAAAPAAADDKKERRSSIATP